MSKQESRLIYLTQGQVATVDADLHEWLNQWKWYAQKASSTGRFYAVRKLRRNASMPMHRQILGMDSSDTLFADHIDGDTLNNRRVNLRIATPSQNAQNQRVFRTNRLGLKGVHKVTWGNKYCACIRVSGKRIYLGNFDDPKDAHAAYCAAAKQHYGEYARGL